MQNENGIKEYYKDGVLEWDIPMVKGKRQGPARCFWPDGQLKISRMYKDDKIEGLETMYYPDGKPWHFTEYRNGKKNGLHRSFHRNGQMEIEESYKDDKKVGFFTRYTTDGIVIFRKDFKGG